MGYSEAQRQCEWHSRFPALGHLLTPVVVSLALLSVAVNVVAYCVIARQASRRSPEVVAQRAKWQLARFCAASVLTWSPYWALYLANQEVALTWATNWST